MTSEQQVILLLSLVGAFWSAVGLWMKFDLDRAIKADEIKKAAAPSPAE